MDWTLERSDWEEPGYTIAEHTSSPPVDWSIVTKIAIHYPGTNTIPAPSLDNFKATLRATQRYYADHRNYSIGYNAVVWDGMTAQVRGEEYRCAANGNTELNRDAFAIQVHVAGQNDDGQPANPAEVDAVRRIIAWCQERAGRELDIVGHRDLKATGCPGGGLYAQVLDGTFRPQKESEMIFTRRRLYDGHIRKGQVVIVDTGQHDATGAIVNLVAAETSGAGYLRVWPAEEPEPQTADLNWTLPGSTIANTAAVGLSGGRFRAVCPNAAIRLVVDLQAVVP